MPAVIAALATAGDNVASAVAAERDNRPAKLTGVVPLRVGPGRGDPRVPAGFPPRSSRATCELQPERTGTCSSRENPALKAGESSQR